MRRIKRFVSHIPLFILFLPLFFVAHGYIENYNFVPFDEALLLLLYYMLISLLVFALTWLLYRHVGKAALFTLYIMSFQFFFGSIFDKLKQLFPGSFLVKYSFILPLSLALLFLVFIVLKRYKGPLIKLVAYLNTLLMVLLVLELGFFIQKHFELQRKNRKAILSDDFFICNNCTKPDIYLIVADEYAGNSELKTLLNFDNSSFLESLRQRGFHVMDKSHSNYISTVYSMASFFNMNYLVPSKNQLAQQLGGEDFNPFQNNSAVRFLKKQGYTIINNSFFDLDQRKAVQLDFLPRQTALITFRTFTKRAWRDIGFNFAFKYKMPYFTNKYIYATLRGNNKILEKTRQEVTHETKKARFIYTHFMMPHFPFYFHRDGSPFLEETLREDEQVIKENYLDYLQYSNKAYLSLIDYILAHSPIPPVILFLSDHGYRHFRNTEPVDDKFKFMNLLTIYLPNSQYNGFPDSLSNVNYLRSFFNVQFNQKFKMIPDSIYEPVEDAGSNESSLRASKWTN